MTCRSLPIVFAAALLAGPAQAVPLVFDYVGASTEGGTITGSFGYDTSAPDTDPSPTNGIYAWLGFSGVITGGAYDGGAFFIPGAPGAVRIRDEDVGTVESLTYSGTPATFVSLASFGGNLFSDDTLPTTLDLGDFTSAKWVFVAGSDVGIFGLPGQIRYTFSSLTLSDAVTVSDPATAPVPLPTPLALLLAGLGMQGLAARRRPSRGGVAA